MTDLSRLVPPRRTGREPFTQDGNPRPFDLLDFWAWAGSDLVSNVNRGRLAEYVVAKALEIPTTGVREEWARFDLVTPEGLTVEVKSCAYIQSWKQERPTSISFSVAKALGWDADTNKQDRDRRRHAQVYVFALLAHREKATIDPLEFGQWRFYVLSTAVLDARTRSQHSITLRSLDKLQAGPWQFTELKEAVRTALAPRQPA